MIEKNSNKKTKALYKRKRVNGKEEYVHRIIAGAKPGEVVDHKDGNKKNNAKKNLRITTKAKNTAKANRERSK